MKTKILLFAVMLLSWSSVKSQDVYLADEPGKAFIKAAGSQVVIENNVLRMTLQNTGKKIKITGFEDKITGVSALSVPVPLFEIKMADSSVVTSDDFILTAKPVIENVNAVTGAQILADRSPGKRYSAELVYKKAGLSLHWEALLHDGSNYVRHLFRFTGGSADAVSRITLLSLPYKEGMRKEGTVEGSPVVYNNMFFALEYPLSNIGQDDKFISSYITTLINSVSTAWGVTPAGQLRRGFLYYVERERAHPYHQVLHYNSWYDISWDTRKFTEAECLDRIKWFGDSLINKRNVQLKAFLFDDGWDDNKTLWKFHSGFPEGFTNIRKAAESYKSTVGVWLSPFGGYGDAKKSRIDYGNRQNPPFETNEQGFSLSGPVYFSRFREVTADFIRKYDVSMFKFDGVGRGSGAGSVYRKDVEAFLKLLRELMEIKPSLYISMTTGTWPSVYWLKFGDNIWRGGDDTGVTGEGSNRQQWITYRDADTYKNVVKRGPLYPLNSLMLGGICIADFGQPSSFEMNDNDISDEMWSFFATGTDLQELYVNPHKLNSTNWDCLAKAAMWAGENERIMTDVHWVGGDPAKGEVYGFASWTPGKAVLSLRNPTAVAKTFVFNARSGFEIPEKISDDFLFFDARSGNKSDPAFRGRSFQIDLKPFQVVIFDAIPENIQKK